MSAVDGNLLAAPREWRLYSAPEGGELGGDGTGAEDGGGEAVFWSHAGDQSARVPCKGNAPICARGMDSPLTGAGGVLCSITA